MKELTAQELQKLTESIFVRFDFKGNFKLLRGFNGETFLTLKLITLENLTFKVSTVAKKDFKNDIILFSGFSKIYSAFKKSPVI